MLDELGVPAFKIASTDNDNYPLLAHIAKKRKPMIISTGMSSMEEILKAKKVIVRNGCKNFAFLQCTGNYPSKESDANVNVIKGFMKDLKCIIGYSDHTTKNISSIAAIAVGAKIIEKHFTVDKNLFGPDHRLSLNAKELKIFIQNIRLAEAVLGSYKKKVLNSEKGNRLKLKKSIISSKLLIKGEVLTKKKITIKRPGDGLRPIQIKDILGKKLKVRIKKNTVIKKWMIK